MTAVPSPVLRGAGEPAGGLRVGPGAAPRAIRVLIVDDSQVARSVLSRMVAAEPGFEVAGQASNADQALDMLRSLLVDIVMLDVEMPGTDGLTALPHILRLGRGARVLIVSSIAEDGAAAAVQALSLGAADTLPKPGGARVAGGRAAGQPAHGSFSKLLISKLRTIGHARREEQRYAPPMVDIRMDAIRLRPMPNHPIRCLAIGASTGGLYALGQLLGALPPRIGIPILVTQHLPAVFMPFFARQLTALSGRESEVATDGQIVTPERILIAPGDGHLQLRETDGAMRVVIDRSGPSGGCMPSVDPMLLSVRDRYAAQACAVVLTGMGRDGLIGAAGIADAGGTVLVQDPASSAVWGMPRSVAEAGHANALLDPVGIAARIAARTGAASASTPSVGFSSWK